MVYSKLKLVAYARNLLILYRGNTHWQASGLNHLKSNKISDKTVLKLKRVLGKAQIMAHPAIIDKPAFLLSCFDSPARVPRLYVFSNLLNH